MPSLISLLAAFFILALGSSCSSVPSTQWKTEPFFSDDQIFIHQLKNGLNLYVLEDHKSPIISIQTWFQVGSQNEAPGHTGLAHLFEHMMFRGTSAHPDGDFDKVLHELGVNGLNAFTNHDNTVYTESIPKESLETVLMLESDRMVNLRVDDVTLNREREVVLNEMRMRSENSAPGKMNEALYELAYKNHPYHWPVIGYTTDLKNTKAKECLEFYKRYYSPDHASIIIVGDVTPDHVLSLVEKYYGNLPPSGFPKNSFQKNSSQNHLRTGTSIQLISIPSQVDRVSLGFLTVQGDHSDAPALDLIAYVLGQGRSSLLQKDWVNSGLASSASSLFYSMKNQGLFSLDFSLNQSMSSKRFLALIKQTLKKLINLSEEDIQAAKSQFLLDNFEGLQRIDQKAHYLGTSESLSGDPAWGTRYLDDLQSVDKKQLQKIIQEYLVENHGFLIYGKAKHQKGSPK